jgi:hypothetical protein
VIQPLVGCGDDAPPVPKKAQASERSPVREDTNLTRWKAVKPARYRYDFHWICYCPQSHDRWEITVENDTVIRAMREGSDSAIVGKDLSIYGFMTIDSLFGFIDAARTIGLTDTADISGPGPADSIHATYDSLYGVPTDVWIDYRLMAADDELGFEVRNLLFETPDN